MFGLEYSYVFDRDELFMNHDGEIMHHDELAQLFRHVFLMTQWIIGYYDNVRE